jgi:hypothetical protein
MHADSLLLRFTRSLSAAEPAERSRARAAVLLADHLAVRGEIATPTASLAEQGAAAAIAAARHDSDDVHWASLVHPGAPIWATALAFAAASPRPGPTAFRAATAGYEAAVRLGLALDVAGGDTVRFHRTALVTPAAVAVTLSTLRGELDPSSIGHALSMAGGSAGAIRELSGSRAIHRGAAVLLGVAAVDAARAGIPSTETDLEYGGGAIPAMSAAAADLLLTPADAIATTSVRVLPTSGWNQTAFEAAREAAAAAGGGAVVEIRAVVPPTVIARSVSHDPWHSLPRALALAAGANEARPPTIDIAPGPGAIAKVTVETANGRATVSVATPLDDPSRPADVADLGAKWGLTPDGAAAWLGTLRDWLGGDDPRPAPPPHRPSMRSAP